MLAGEEGEDRIQNSENRSAGVQEDRRQHALSRTARGRIAIAWTARDLPYPASISKAELKVDRVVQVLVKIAKRKAALRIRSSLSSQSPVFCLPPPPMSP